MVGLGNSWMVGIGPGIHAYCQGSLVRRDPDLILPLGENRHRNRGHEG